MARRLTPIAPGNVASWVDLLAYREAATALHEWGAGAARHLPFLQVTVGIDPKAARSRAGYSSVAFVMCVYSYAVGVRQRGAAEWIDDLLLAFREK